MHVGDLCGEPSVDLFGKGLQLVVSAKPGFDMGD